jgi:hypothetical protein
MTSDDMKMRRAARRAQAMNDAAAKAMWSGRAAVVPNKKRAASKRACRTWRYDG